ncbi:trihelix transcription factor ASR3-like isoform X2 [Fagus crenata]
MSDPPTTLIPLKPHIATTTTTITTAAATSSPLIRDYRKGNWTIQETLILITAKKLDEERRVKAASSTPPPDPTTPTTKPPCKPGGELRWKWVENYCWNHGCLRSQNQCNDKWDNLLRDYKKVREYESKSNASKEFPSYWNIEKQDRKDRNLPSNMAFEVFQALNQVLQRRYSQTSASPPAKPVLSFAPSPTPVTVVPPNLPPAPAPMRPPEISGTAAIPLSDSSETDSSEMHGSSSKRRKVRRSIGSSIKRSASVLARTFRDCEEKKEKRHQEAMEIEQRRLQIEEKQNEVNHQGMANLVAAMTNLSGAIQSLISASHDHQ